MKDEIKEIKLWKEKTKGIFHITEYTRFWNYITNLQQDNTMYAQLKDEYEEEIKDLQQIEQEHKKLNAELRRENSNLKTSLDEAQEVLSEYKEENERLKEYYNKAMELIDKGVENSYKLLKDYKQRIDKAIDKLTIKQARFINENDYILDDNDLDEIMYILQNGIDENTNN